MATLKQTQARKNMFNLLLIVLTAIISYFSYTREDIYLFGILGSLLFGAPILFWILFVRIRITWDTKYTPFLKFIIFAILPILIYGRLSVSTPSEDIIKDDFRIATYNLNLYNEETEEQLTILEKIDADILSLIEVNKNFEHDLKKYSETYPFIYKSENIHANKTVGLSIILSKYIITNKQEIADGYLSRADVLVNGKILHIIQAHPVPPMGKNLTKKRNATLKAASLLELGENKIFLGDFNTVHWQKPIKEITEKQGLRVASKGMLTWPSILPVAPIDHILTSFNLSPKGSGKICSTASDHCLIYADINLKENVVVKTKE